MAVTGTIRSKTSLSPEPLRSMDSQRRATIESKKENLAKNKYLFNKTPALDKPDVIIANGVAKQRKLIKGVKIEKVKKDDKRLSSVDSEIER